MIKKVSITVLILTLLLAGCSASSSNPGYPVEAPSVALESQRQSVGGDGYSPEKAAFALDQSVASVERLVIKNASLSIAVNDPLKSMDTISRMAQAMDGFVVSADMYQPALRNGIK